jgi:hypothetical protein
MKITNNNAWVMPAMDVIENTAPKLYAEMQATDWPVTVISKGDDLRPIFDELSKEVGWMDAFGFTNQLAAHLDSAYGVTVAATDESPDDAEQPPDALNNKTWLNKINLESGAKEMGVPLPKMVADTIVHEFTHRQGRGERGAYDMGAKFARAMGEEKLAESQDETGVHVQLDSLLERIMYGDA